MFLYTFDQYKYEVRYDDKCSTIGFSCTVTIDIKEDIEGPVHLYYGLTNFNQNQRFYAISKS